MYRLTKPEDLGSQVFRYQLSTGLALGGIALAVVLTANLARTLRHHRIDEERLRQEQEKLREELRRSEHLASLGKLLAGVAHEIRNPLAGIRSTVQLWERLPDTTRTPSSMNAVIQAVDRLNAIVTRLLYFARADGAERESVSINPMILETLELLSAQSSAQGVTLEHPLQDGLPAVLGSANALRQVFLNLATNALQAMPGGGCLRVGTRLLCEKHQVEICFVDTGTGITPEDLPHVFDPFYTTRPEGTGLGLALCQEIVQQHGGKIELTSSVGVGSSFRVLLPAT
jgi:signal transduction histidine kinase